MNKALILLIADDSTRYSQGRDGILQAINQSPPIVDLDILDTLDQPDVRKRIGPHLLSSMWEKAQTQQPQNEGLLSFRLTKTFMNRDYMTAQKVNNL